MLFFLLYIVLFLTLTPYLEVGVNYLVVLPILSATFCFGFYGGIISGTLGLAMNIALLYLKGDLCWVPSSLPMAQFSGMTIGFGLGLTGSYLRRLETEMMRRLEREEELGIALSEKEVLYRELNHRVKNNLNLIKSLIQLQIYRSENAEFTAEAEKLMSRIFSIALVHEQLYSGILDRDINPRDYLIKLIEQIAASQYPAPVKLKSRHCEDSLSLSMEKAVPLGLIVNEVVTNIIKYAFEDSLLIQPELVLQIQKEENTLVVEILDNGRGFEPGEEKAGLGITLIQTLAGQLKGDYAYRARRQGTRFVLRFPL
jgi:two-component sensor histidine kinase